MSAQECVPSMRAILEIQKWYFIDQSMTCQLRANVSYKLLLLNPYDPYLRRRLIADRYREAELDLLIGENRHNIELLDEIDPTSTAIPDPFVAPVPGMFLPGYKFLGERLNVAKMYQRLKVI